MEEEGSEQTSVGVEKHFPDRFVPKWNRLYKLWDKTGPTYL